MERLQKVKIHFKAVRVRSQTENQNTTEKNFTQCQGTSHIITAKHASFKPSDFVMILLKAVCSDECLNTDVFNLSAKDIIG